MTKLTDPPTDTTEADRSPRPPARSSVAPPKGKSRRRTLMRWLRRGVLAVFVLAAIGLIVTAALPKPAPVDLARVESKAMQVTVDEDGKARVKDRYVVSAPLSGSLARIELHHGDSVEQGAILARIVPLAAPLLDDRSRTSAEARVAAALASQRQAAAQIERAKAAAAYAKTDSTRNQQLFDKGAISKHQLEQALLGERTTKAELDSLRFGARVADYEVQMARAALGHLSGDKDRAEQLEVPSPVTGRILKVLRESEGVVQAGTPLLEVGDPGALEIVADVLTSDAVHIEPGSQVTVDRWGGAPLEARVRVVEPSAFTRLSALGVEEQRVNVVVDLVAPRAEWSSLGDGYRAEAHIVVWEGTDVVQVPSSAVFRHDDGWAVFQVEQGIAQLVTVEIGHRNGREVEIESGLAPGAEVVLHPSDRIAAGIEVVQR